MSGHKTGEGCEECDIPAAEEEGEALGGFERMAEEVPYGAFLGAGEAFYDNYSDYWDGETPEDFWGSWENMIH